MSQVFELPSDTVNNPQVLVKTALKLIQVAEESHVPPYSLRIVLAYIGADIKKENLPVELSEIADVLSQWAVANGYSLKTPGKGLIRALSFIYAFFREGEVKKENLSTEQESEIIAFTSAILEMAPNNETHPYTYPEIEEVQVFPINHDSNPAPIIH